MIKLFYPANQYWEECLNDLSVVLQGRWWGQAHRVEEFERMFAEEFAYKHCLAVNSGSAALELAYHLLNISEGDEVISPVLTCTATNLPLARRKAKIVFADIEKETLTLDPEDVEKKITENTKLIVAVTLGGMPINKKIFDIAKKHGIPVVIDAAQSLGLTETQGDYICYSFQAIKHFSTGDGGMLVLRDNSEYARAKKLRWFGIDRDAKAKADWQAYRYRQMTIDIEEAGYKYQMNDIAATLGLVGLKHSDEILAIRRKVAKQYIENLKNCEVIAGGSYWLFGVLINNRDEYSERLIESGIDVNMVHLRNDIYDIFGGQRQDLPNMNSIEPKYVYLPIHPNLTEEQVDTIITTFNSIVK